MVGELVPKVVIGILLILYSETMLVETIDVSMLEAYNFIGLEKNHNRRCYMG